MKRICYIIGQLDRGGAERQLFELASSLATKACSVYVIALQPGGYWRKPLEDAGVHVTELPRSVRFPLRRLFAVLRELIRIRPHVLHTWLFSANTYGRLAGRLLRVPAILSSERNMPVIGKDKSRFASIIDDLLAPTSDAIVCNTYAAASALAPRGRGFQNRLQVVHNGVRIAGDAARPDCKKAGTPTVLMVARLTAQKHPECFLRVAAHVHETPGCESVRFRLVGKGELAPDLHRASVRMGLEGVVEIAGESDDIASEYAAADVFVLTSKYEGLPNAVMEAMASGLPVVATRTGGTPELVDDGVNGFLCPEGDAKRIADRVIHLLRHPDLAAQMGARGRRRIGTEFRVDDMVRKTRNIYELLLAGRRPNPVRLPGMGGEK